MTRNSAVKNNREKDLVSILVPTYNRPALLERAIKSLLEQSYKKLEIVVVNDAGRDVQDVVNSFKDLRIKYFQNSENKGLAGTRNVALKNCKGDYICLLDDDDIYLKYAIEFRMYMMKKLKAEIVYTRSLLDHWDKTDKGYASKGKTLYWDSFFDKDLILIQNIAPCCNVLFSRKAWDEADYWFDETMTTSEDHDFWVSLSRKNNFEELKLIDTECSKRSDNTQMTGTLNFAPNWIKIFKRWRHTAINSNYVISTQNKVLERVGINPKDYGL